MLKTRLRVAAAALAAATTAVLATPADATAPTTFRTSSAKAKVKPGATRLTTSSLPPEDDSCEYLPRFSPTGTSVPGDAEEVQAIYFLANNTVTMNYDLATLCADGRKSESSIGYALHNMRRWMSTRGSDGANGSLMSGKAFDVRLRTDTKFGITTKSYQVAAVRGPSDEAYYQQSGYATGSDGRTHSLSFVRIQSELEARGFNRPHVKYIVFAQLHQPTGGIVGESEVNGNLSIVWQKIGPAGAPVSVPWGCATEGDTTVVHELIHAWGFLGHVGESRDLMYASDEASTLSGATSIYVGPKPVTGWDLGADSYTNRVLSFPNYLGAGPGSPLHTC